jgi:hypothetical protein
MKEFKLREIEERALARGWLDERDLEQLRRVLSDDWQVSRREADALLRLRQRVHDRPPAFDRFFYEAVGNYLVRDGRISAAEAGWLREMLYADRKVDDEERQFLRRLKDEVREASPEFEALFAEAMKQPREPHSSGG